MNSSKKINEAQAAWLASHGFTRRGDVFEVCFVPADRYEGREVKVDGGGWLIVDGKHNGCTAERVTIALSTWGAEKLWTVTRVHRMRGRCRTFDTKREAAEYARDRVRFALDRGGYRRVERSAAARRAA